MRKVIALFTIFAFSVSLSSCVTTDQSGNPNAGKSAQSGAFLGAIGGALTGFFATGKLAGAVKGAVIGAAVGALTGFIVGKSREKQYKTAKQIYAQKPHLVKESARNQPPSVVGINPVVFDKNGAQKRSIKNGEWIELGTRYEIDIPLYSTIKEVRVIESNTLIDPNGSRMNDLKREKIRSCGAVESAVQVLVPKDLPSGKYTHYASVIIDGQQYETSQPIQVVKVNGEIHMYALN
jgi:hypothetical protein